VRRTAAAANSSRSIIASFRALRRGGRVRIITRNNFITDVPAHIDGIMLTAVLNIYAWFVEGVRPTPTGFARFSRQQKPDCR
jgi:hypothetical protein